MMVSPASYHNEQFPCLRGGPFFILDGIVPPRFELCTAAHGAQEDVSVKRSFAVLALFSAGFLAAQDRVAPPAGLAPMVQPADTSVCADVKDAENYCVWDSAKGTHGRKCTLDVEKIERSAACRYDLASVPDRLDHKPMCFSISNAEHIAFTSSKKRKFRVRRLVPITATGTNGQACPNDPFKKSFKEEDFSSFDVAFDSDVPKTEAEGCKYKLEVQFRKIDPNAPAEPHDPKKQHLECRDPHLLLKSGT
jgi:hypothetical protein